MAKPARRDEGVDLALLHDLKNLVGVVHAAAVDLGHAHAAGEDLAEPLAELASLSGLVSEALRGLAGDGRALRPFDLRAAALCARVRQRNLAVDALLRPARADAEAGALTELVVALADALGAGEAVVVVREDLRAGLVFEPAVPLARDAQVAVDTLGARASELRCALEAEGGRVRLRPR